MTLKEVIHRDLAGTLKAREELKTSVLRLLSAAISNKESDKRTKIWQQKPELAIQELEKESQLSDEEILEVISSEAKKRKEAIELYSARGGSALGGEKEKINNTIEKEKREMEILKTYLPEQLPEAEIKKLVREAVAALRASLAPSEREKVGQKDVGKVMGVLMPQIKGRADGNLVSQIVKESLTSQK